MNIYYLSLTMIRQRTKGSVPINARKTLQYFSRKEIQIFSLNILVVTVLHPKRTFQSSIQTYFLSKDCFLQNRMLSLDERPVVFRSPKNFRYFFRFRCYGRKRISRKNISLKLTAETKTKWFYENNYFFNLKCACIYKQ